MIAPPPLVAAAVQIAPLPDTIVNELLARIDGIPGGVFVIGRREGSATRVDVVARRAGPYAGDSLFEIGSLTKPLTGALLADAVRRGTVRYDQTVDALLPHGIAAPAVRGMPITLEALAEQRSGLPRLPQELMTSPELTSADPYARFDRTRLYAALAGAKPQRASGSAYEYSNFGYAVLGSLLADHSGMDYAALLRTRLLAPLGMTQTTADDTLDAKLVPGFDGNGDARGPWHMNAFAPAGAVRSTVDDLLRLAGALFPDAQGAAADALREAARPRADAGALGAIGLGWMLSRGGMLWHNGEAAGYRSWLGAYPRERRAVVILSNVAEEPGPDDVGAAILDPRNVLVATPQLASIPASALAGLPGTYSAGGTDVQVVRDARGLRARMPQGDDVRLWPSSRTAFFVRTLPMKMQFDLGRDGRATGATLNVAGTEIPLTRVAP